MLGDGFRVLVVGAGIAGLAAARTLRRYGIAVEEVELAQGDLMIGAGMPAPLGDTSP